MDNYLLELIKSKNNNFFRTSNKAYLFYFHDPLRKLTSDVEIDYSLAEKLDVGSFYQDEYLHIYQILGKQYDSKDNIVLLCKFIK